MLRYRKHRVLIRHTISLLTVPLVLMSVGYAVFTQQLSINTSTKNPTYAYSQGLRMTYVKSVAPSGQSLQYTMNPVTIKSVSGPGVTAWQFVVTLPADYTNVSCQNTVSCSTNGTTLTITNGTGNGTINPSGQITFTFSFKTSIPNYSLQNINISGTAAQVYQTMAGLTMTATAGPRVKKGSTYFWDYTITVINATGQNLTGWRIRSPWNSTTEQVKTMPATVNYIVNPTQLTITSTTGLNNGSNFVFVPNFGSTNINWVWSGYVVEGLL